MDGVVNDSDVQLDVGSDANFDIQLIPSADSPYRPESFDYVENNRKLQAGSNGRPSSAFAQKRNNTREARKYEEAYKVGQLYLQGLSKVEIGQRLGMKVSLVHSRVQWMRLYWRNAAQSKAMEVIAFELAKIDLMEKEAWEQWQRSKEDAVEEIEEESLSPGGSPTKRKAKKRSGRLGDKGYLDLALKCLEMRRKLLGIGDEDKAKPQSMLSRVVEIVVDSIDDVPKVLDYAEFESMAAAANLEQATIEQANVDVPPGDEGLVPVAEVVADSDFEPAHIIDHLADV